jgi:hypothetical protein
MLREILKFILKVDLRTIRNGKIKHKRIYSILIVNFLWFLFLSLSVAFSESQDTSFKSFALDFVLIILSLEFFLVFLSVLTEFETLIINQTEIELFSFLPISPSSYKVAKFLNFLFYILLLSLSFNIAPGLVLFFFSSLVYGLSWGKGILISISYLITSFLFSISISNIVTLFIFLTRLGSKDLNRFILPLQILVVFLTFFAYQVLNRYLLSSTSAINLFDKFVADTFFSHTPPVIFSKIFAFFSGIDNSFKVFETLLVLFISVLLVFLTINFMSIKNLLDMLEQKYKRKKSQKVIPAFLKISKRFLFKNEIEVAFYDLIYVHLKRDRSVRIKILTAFTISVAVAIYILTFNEIDNPIVKPTSRANVIMLMTLLLTASVGVTTFINHRDFKASWIYNFIKQDKLKMSMNALEKVLWFHTLFPLIVIFCFVYLILVCETEIILTHLLITILLVKTFSNITMLIANAPPFSKPIDKISSSEKIYANLLTLPFTISAVMLEKWSYSFFRYGLHPNIFWFIMLLFIVERLLNKKVKDSFKWKAIEEL